MCLCLRTSKQMIDVKETLRTLAPTRPIFHSEADFQHALAWHIHNRHPELKVRLEYRPAIVGRKVHIDIWLEREGSVYAIELKYKTRRLSTSVHGESFDLLNHSAHDCARYDVCKDVSRVESLSQSSSTSTCMTSALCMLARICIAPNQKKKI